jgi:rod shape-determining protein MreD
MPYLIGIPLVVVLAILQSAVFSHLGILDGRLDLVLLAVVSWSLAGRPVEAMVWGWVGGLTLDLLSGMPFGVSAILLVLIAYLGAFTEGRFWEGHGLVPLAAVLAAAALFHIAGGAALLLSGSAIDVAAGLGRVVLPSLFLDLVLALPAQQAAEGLRGWLFPPRVTVP